MTINSPSPTAHFKVNSFGFWAHSGGETEVYTCIYDTIIPLTHCVYMMHSANDPTREQHTGRFIPLTHRTWFGYLTAKRSNSTFYSFSLRSLSWTRSTTDGFFLLLIIMTLRDVLSECILVAPKQPSPRDSSFIWHMSTVSVAGNLGYFRLDYYSIDYEDGPNSP